MVLTICTNSIHISRSFINYESDIGFINKFIFSLPYEECSKYKMYIIIRLYKLIVESFFI
jgi:hypothetical protein